MPNSFLGEFLGVILMMERGRERVGETQKDREKKRNSGTSMLLDLEFRIDIVKSLLLMQTPIRFLFFSFSQCFFFFLLVWFMWFMWFRLVWFFFVFFSFSLPQLLAYQPTSLVHHHPHLFVFMHTTYTIHSS